MGRLAAAVGLALALVQAVLSAQPLPRDLALRAWFVAALEHQPGRADQALVEIGTWGFEEFDAIRRHLRDGLVDEFDREDVRRDVIRRGVLLHTDIALLRPDLAVRFDRLERLSPLPSIDVGSDAQYLGQSRMTAHWAFARGLVERLPDGAADPFARAWYRAVAARLLFGRELATALDHLGEGLRHLPDDPLLLFYAGALHESYASSRVQNLLASLPGGRPRPAVGSPRQELEAAARLLRRSVALEPGMAEARLRLGRILGLQGHHQEALAELEAARPIADDPLQQYYIEMMSADALASLGRPEEARAALERAATLFPRAQSPILALSALARRQGDIASAAAIVGQIRGLPGHTFEVIDPWWVYGDSCVLDAEARLARVGALLEGGGGR